MPALTERPASTVMKSVATGRRDIPASPHAAPKSVPDKTVEIIQPYDQFMNRRVEPRFESDARGCLLFLSRSETVPCQIVNQSASGAQVLFDTIGDVPAELWLIDLDSNTAKRGSAAWSTPHKMGLKFNLIQSLSPTAPRPPKVPEDVYRTWLNLSGAGIPKPDQDDVLFLD